MSIVTYPLNNINFSAEDAEIYNSTRTSGVYALDGNLACTITGAREVTISPGMAWIKNDDFSGKAIAVKDPVVLELDVPDAALERIDRIVLQFSLAENASSVIVKTGEASSSPMEPERITMPDVYELVLYDISIPHGMIELTEANITDQRANEDLCGLMTDGIGTLQDYLRKVEFEEELNNFFYFKRVLTSADDLNNVTETGIYYFSTSSLPANAPFSNAAIVEVINTGSNDTRVIQRCTRYGTAAQAKERVLYSGTWQEWTQKLLVFVSTRTTTTNNNGNANTGVNANLYRAIAIYAEDSSGGSTYLVNWYYSDTNAIMANITSVTDKANQGNKSFKLTTYYIPV